MKLTFSKFAGSARSGFLCLLAGVCLCPLAGMATDPIFINSGIISGTPPQVDATNFYNSGTWAIATVSPYETANTLTYTNTGGGSMTASPGWEFDLGPATAGSRTAWSSVFFNDNGCTIQAFDGSTILLATVSAGGSSLLVQATNIINKGRLLATPSGQIKLIGSTVNLSRSTLNIPPIQGLGSANDFFRTNFTPDVSIFDEYWGEGNTNLFSPGVWQNGTAVSAAFPDLTVFNPCATSNAAPLLSFTPSFSAWTNVADPNSVTNLTNASGSSINVTNRYFRQAVFVTVHDPNFVTNNPGTNSLIRFTPTGSVSNLFQTVSVWLHSTNATDLYIVDTLGSQTNRGVLSNSSNSNTVPGLDPINPCTAPRFRPANYTVERVDGGFTNGFAGNVTPPPANFLYDVGSPPSIMAFSNTTVIADVSAYQAYVDNLAFNPSWDAISNLPGRIIINANTLDLTRTVISNSGPDVVIQANNLTGSASAVISCQNLNYTLGSSNGMVNVSNLATNGTLPALNGTVSLWSAEWTNFQAFVHFPGTTNSITNNVEYDFHVLLADASQLSTTVPVTVQNLILQTNAVINDSMNLAGTFFFGGQSLTLNGSLSLSGNLQNWSSALAPTLLYFTNNNFLSIPNEAHFGDDRTAPYNEFVNAGQIYASGQTIRSLDLQIVNGGLNQTLFGNFSATAQSIEMTAGASISSAANMQLAANTVNLSQSLLLANGAMNFIVTNSFLDNGLATIFECGNGFNLLTAPQSGNLSASTIIDVASSNTFDNVGPEIDHDWEGKDAGPAAAGTVNNAALGTLSLVAVAPAQLPTFHFYGNSHPNAMYVKTLDLSQLTGNPADLTSMIQIDPGMTIYFANVTANATFISKLTGGQTPATYLQSQFPNQFISDGNVGLSIGGTSTNIVISGIAARPAGSFVLTWNSTAGATYSVLKSGVLSPSTNWPAIVTNYPAGGAIGGPLSYTDTTATVSPAFYRVMVGPQVAQ